MNHVFIGGFALETQMEVRQQLQLGQLPLSLGYLALLIVYRDLDEAYINLLSL
jgi:hypothetical protein